MSDKLKRIVINVFKDNLTGSFESEDNLGEEKENDAWVELESAIEDVCSNHKVEVDSIEFRTR